MAYYITTGPAVQERLREQLEEQRAKQLGLDRIRSETLRRIVDLFLPPAEQLAPLPGGAIFAKPQAATIFAGKNYWDRLFGGLSRLVRERQLSTRIGEPAVSGPWYHGTAAGPYREIQRSGWLKPHSETGFRIWSGGASSRQPGVYLAREPERAFWYALKAAEKTGTPPVVLRVRGVPTDRFVVDEDVAFLAGTGTPRETLLLPWVRSAAFPVGFRKRLMESAGVIDYHTPGKAVKEIGQQRTGIPSGLGSVAYAGRIPTEAIDVVVAPRKWASSSGKYMDPIERARAALAKEQKAVEESMRQVLQELVERRQRHPWWL